MKIILGITFIFILISAQAFAQGRKQKSYPRVEIKDLESSKYDTLEVIASVKSIYKCPPCPQGAQCKPCIGDHVEVIYGEVAQWARFFTHEPEKYQAHKAYIFLVRFRSSFHRIDNIEIISSSPI